MGREKVGEGLQYEVFRESEDRVRKIPKDRKEMKKYLEDRYDSKAEIMNHAEKAMKRRKKAVEQIKMLGIDYSMLGNPYFDGREIVQDWIKPLEEFFTPDTPEEEMKTLIDRYINFLIEGWRQGFADMSYNFTVNKGLSDGEIVQMDTGELIFSKERVRKDIENRKYLEKWSYQEDLPEKIRPYYREQMEKRVTVETLNENWKKNR